MNKKPKRTKTQKKLTGWKFLRGFMATSKYVVAELPATIMIIVQHNDWFPTVTQTVSVSMGFSMFCITVLVSLFCIANKEKTFKKISPFITAAVYFVIAGIVLLFMSKIANDLGWLCVYTGIGMIIAVVENTVEKNVVSKKVDYWSGVLSEAGLNNKENEYKKKKQASSSAVPTAIHDMDFNIILEELDDVNKSDFDIMKALNAISIK